MNRTRTRAALGMPRDLRVVGHTAIALGVMSLLGGRVALWSQEAAPAAAAASDGAAAKPAVAKPTDPPAAAAASAPAKPSPAKPAAAAPQYKVIESKAPTDPKQIKNMETREVAPVIKGSGPLSPADQTALRKYFVDYLMAGFTHVDRVTSPQQFPQWRKKIAFALNAMGQDATNRSRHAFLRDRIFEEAKKIAEDVGYHPISRYNAILVLGELNEREVKQNAADRFAVPLEKARPVLIKLANSDPSQVIQVGALIGLNRHAKLLAASKQTDPEIVKSATRVLKLKNELGPNGTLDGLYWMQRIGIEILGAAGKPDAIGLLDPIVNDAQAPLPVRCAAAEALGLLDYANAKDVPWGSLSKGLGSVAVLACQQQVVALKDAVKNGGGQFEGSRLTAPEEGADKPENPQVLQVRRELKYNLQCVSRGLAGLVKANGDANAKAPLMALQTEVNTLLKSLEADPELIPETMLDKLNPSIASLEAAVKKAG